MKHRLPFLCMIMFLIGWSPSAAPKTVPKHEVRYELSFKPYEPEYRSNTFKWRISGFKGLFTWFHLYDPKCEIKDSLYCMITIDPQALNKPEDVLTSETHLMSRSLDNFGVTPIEQIAINGRTFKYIKYSGLWRDGAPCKGVSFATIDKKQRFSLTLHGNGVIDPEQVGKTILQAMKSR